MKLLVLFFSLIIGVFAQNIYGKHSLITYVVDWDIPASIPWNKLDHISYAFAIPNKSGTLSGFNKPQLIKVVKEAHAHGKGVSLAIGGSLVKTEESRKRFAVKLLTAVEQYDLNGLNIDWEYPNDLQGISCNQKDPQDTSNFLAFIQLLRQMLDEKYPQEHKLITSAVSTYTFKDEQRNSIKRLDEGWSKYMDAFYIMAYDMTGVFSKDSSANAPLSENLQDPLVSGAASVQQWINAGIPSQKTYLGVPFYGYTHKTAQHITNDIHVPLDRSIQQIKGDIHDDYAADPCPGSTRSYSGEIQWRTIEQSGLLRNLSGWTTLWDPVSQTPFAYKSESQQFVTFDNPLSLKVKTDYVIKHKLGGMMLWSLEMDDKHQSLLNAMQKVRQ
ncbi:hypothetical protein G6F56_000221 [Rhizopus delemar]|uniref:GH18 domain-containing protein n=1 Tax=Rhizopus stolonifer TaxID=4846 RepID=A0A367JTN0_RHIST|nr:hypothetical protein G6F56_000221 [Rhizopus delemar]RCH93300.1 hypothetical protein CU098_007236 [Rhizopus stolonifer]